jgi:hypothetical protein
MVWSGVLRNINSKTCSCASHYSGDDDDEVDDVMTAMMMLMCDVCVDQT